MKNCGYFGFSNVFHHFKFTLFCTSMLVVSVRFEASCSYITMHDLLIPFFQAFSSQLIPFPTWQIEIKRKKISHGNTTVSFINEWMNVSIWWEITLFGLINFPIHLFGLASTLHQNCNSGKQQQNENLTVGHWHAPTFDNTNYS